tara:strand:- start:348 stop:1766 length:1419 start_codon:yes stop_codon:yes gene_type:complete
MIFNVPENNWASFINPIIKKEFKQIFESEVSIFSGFFEDNEKIYLFRDFLGVSTLFYRVGNGKLNISYKLDDLLKSEDRINLKGALNFIYFGSCRFFPLIEEIKICPPGSVISFNKKNNQIKLEYKHKIAPDLLKNYKFDEIVDMYDEKLSSASKKNKYKGKKAIFMGGGIDAGCVAIKSDEKLDAITALPWGSKSSEKLSSSENIKLLGINEHKFIEVNSNTFSKENLINDFGVPLGSMNYLVINQIIKKNLVREYSTLMFGQGADTLFCSAGSQSTAALLPWPIRKFYMKEDDPVGLFLKMTSGGSLSENDEIINDLIPKNLSKVQRIIFAGLKITHTPVDSEYFVIPAFKNNKFIFNPYYDLDLIKFLLGTKKKIILDYSKRTRKFPFKFDKDIQKSLWVNNTNSKISPQKKNFYLSSKYAPIKNFLSSTPSKVNQYEIINENQKFAAHSLINFCQMHDLKLELNFQFN